MKKTALTSCLLILVIGLNSRADIPFITGPRTMEEAFPQRNQDPRLGVIVNKGTVHLNLFIYDEAGRLIEQIYLSGANSWLTINGQTPSRYWIRQLEVGRYRVEVHPFYYQNQLLVGRWRIDLPKQVTSIYVNRDPTDYYCWDLGRHFGWILYLNGGYAPETAHGLPGIQVNVWGSYPRQDRYPRSYVTREVLVFGYGGGGGHRGSHRGRR